jgi:hypothetical protein
VKASRNIEENTNLATCVPDTYHQFLSVFTEQISEVLQPYRSFDHVISLKGDEHPPWGPIYALSETKMKALKEFLDEILQTGKI